VPLTSPALLTSTALLTSDPQPVFRRPDVHPAIFGPPGDRRLFNQYGRNRVLDPRGRRVNQSLRVERSNLCENPSFEANTAGWVGVAGTSTPVLSRVNTDIQNPPNWPLYGLCYAQVTFTAGTTTAAGGVGYTLPQVPADVMTQQYTASASIRLNSHSQRIRARWAYFISGAWQYVNGDVVAVQTMSVGYEWFRLSATGKPAGAVKPTVVRFELVAESGAGSRSWGAYGGMDVDGCLVEPGPLVGEYFDPSESYITATDNSEASWLGAPDQSRSVVQSTLKVVRRNLAMAPGRGLAPWAVDTIAADFYDTDYDASTDHGGVVDGMAYKVTRANSTPSGAPAILVRVGVESPRTGQRYAVSFWVWLPVAATVTVVGGAWTTIGTMALFPTVTSSSAAVPAGQWTKLSGVFQVPAGGPYMALRAGLQLPSGYVATPLYLDGFLVEQGERLLDWFDGASSFDSPLKAAYVAQSGYISTLRAPFPVAPSVSAGGWLLEGNDVDDNLPIVYSDSTGAVLQPSATSASGQWGGVLQSAGGVGVETRTGLAQLTALDAGTWRVRMGVTTYVDSMITLAAGETGTVRLSGSVDAANVALRVGFAGTDASQNYGPRVSIRGLGVFDGVYDGFLFDGSTPDTGEYSFAWSGETFNSESVWGTRLPIGNSFMLEVYDKADPSKFLDALPNRIDPTYLDEMGLGGGEVTLLRSDPKLLENPSLLSYRNVVRVRLNGKVVGAWIINKIETTVVGEGEESEEAVKVSGPGLRAWLSDAVVYSERPSDPTLLNRNFNFAAVAKSSWYVPQDWRTPFEQIQVRTTTTWDASLGVGNPWPGAPADWPDAPAAMWIWDRDTRRLSDFDGEWITPPGDVYFRRTFSTTKTKDYLELFVACDSFCKVFVDGAQILDVSDENKDDNWSKVHSQKFTVASGSHVLAIRATNDYNPSADAGFASVAGLSAALFRQGDAKAATSAALLFVSQSSGWECLPYPATPPGFNPGELFSILHDEAVSRGVTSLSHLSRGFDQYVDSNGVLWPRKLDWSFEVGTEYSDVAEKVEELMADVWVDPVTMTFNAAIARGVDRSVQRAGGQPVVLGRAMNLTRYELEGEASVKNALLLGYEGGVSERLDPRSSRVAYGRIEGYLNVGSGASKDRALAVSDATFSQRAVPMETTTVEFEAITDHVPWVDFFVGDWVAVVTSDLGTRVTAFDSLPTTQVLVPRRVVSLACEEDKDTGRIMYTAEFDTIPKSRQQRVERWLQSTAPGTLGGSVANSSGRAQLREIV
jgi:hypothetical protein